MLVIDMDLPESGELIIDEFGNVWQPAKYEMGLTKVGKAKEIAKDKITIRGDNER